MDLATLKKIVSKGEGLQTEFKRKAKFPEKILKEVIAFANTEGGYLIIGVDDNKSIAGLRYPDEEEFIMRKAIEKYCFPNVLYQTERIEIGNDLSVLVFWIEKGKQTPYSLSDKDEIAKVFVRVADKSIQASREVRRILKKRAEAKDIQFRYGEKEKILMEYLANYSFITVRRFSQVAQISMKLASQTLVLLTAANVLTIQPSETEDTYILKT
jgi:predicted HTH transcriptional regulator